MKQRRFKIGNKVRVKGERGTAEIVLFLSDVKGGVILDRHIGGFRCWNVLDLRHVTK